MEDGQCPKCNTIFERPKYIPLKHPGYFCPECRRMGYKILGIVHFSYNPFDKDITTA